jgi:double-strand break repair protein MRE11
MNMVIYGHEHECLIDPTLDHEMGFHVMQPGSSVATSLCPGEAVSKHVAIMSVTGREFATENIRLKTVRPFVMKEIVLADEPAAVKIAKKKDNKSELTRHLIDIVNGLIEKAKADWIEAQDDRDDDDEEQDCPLPLIRLRVEYTAPEGGRFDTENPQRFSNRFIGKVANQNDVVQFYRKKSSITRRNKDGIELPEESVLASLAIDNVKVEKLVREFLMAQSLTILPQNSFGDAVSQFVDKDDRHAMEVFVNESLSEQIKHMMDIDHADDEEMQNAMELYRTKLEELFASGQIRRKKSYKLKPKPDNWDTDIDGDWEDEPGARIIEDGEGAAMEEDEMPAPKATTKRGAAAKALKAAPKKATAKKTTTARGKKTIESDDEPILEDSIIGHPDEDSDVDMLSAEETPVKPVRGRAAAAKPAAKTPAARKAPARGAAATQAAASKQAKLNFSQSQAPSQPPSSGVGRRGAAKPIVQEISDDEISDDDEAFEPAPSTATLRGSRSSRR